jgi:hypothetical protein
MDIDNAVSTRSQHYNIQSNTYADRCTYVQFLTLYTVLADTAITSQSVYMTTRRPYLMLDAAVHRVSAVAVADHVL